MNNENFNFKTALLSDSLIISNLVNSAYRGDSSKKGWTTEADLLDGTRTTPQKIEILINQPEGQFELLLDSHLNLLACVHIFRENESTLYFGMLTTLPTNQGIGIGKLMLNHIEGIAKSESRSEVRLSVLNFRKELIAFYERRGFKATGKFENFPEDDPDFGIPKVSGLKLLEFIKQF